VNQKSSWLMLEQRLSHRWWTYLLLIAIGLLLFLPNLGRFSLWDIDEAHNSECAREMWESRELVIPTFNYLLRTDKPVLLYWCVEACYQVFGVTEFSARFPSFIAGLLNLLLCYELGRLCFDKWTGLLAAMILGSSFMFCVASHAVTPDALLILTVQATFLTWIIAYRRQQPTWMLLTGICAGLALLSKGPVGVVLPAAIVLLFLVWQRDWRFLLTQRFIQASLLVCAVALPWYIAVGVETHLDFIKGFFLTHNLNRFSTPLEGHQGPIYYHLLAILIAFAPWSIFLGPAVWYRISELRQPMADSREQRVAADHDSAVAYLSSVSASRFLLCWIIVWLTIFSLSATKLPNYVLPIYPPLAILTSRFLVRWSRNEVAVPKWVWRCSLSCLLLIGLGLATGLIVATGWISMPQLAGKTIPDLAYLLPVVFIPLATGFLTWRYWNRQQLQKGIITLGCGSLLLTAALAAWGPTLVDEERCIRPLATLLNQSAGNADIRIGSHPQFYRPSLVFYTRREMIRCSNDAQALEFLQSPLTTYMLVPARDWPTMADQLAGRCSVIDSRHDFTLGQDVFLICNQPLVLSKQKQGLAIHSGR
jgi:4-amino-4-deoxy-L-arabinose transferase-like glycosyltransferase